MANYGPNTNASQFYITLCNDSMTHLDGRYVAFGRVKTGKEVLKVLSDVASYFEDTGLRHKVTIEDCGEYVRESPTTEPVPSSFQEFCKNKSGEAKVLQEVPPVAPSDESERKADEGKRIPNGRRIVADYEEEATEIGEAMSPNEETKAD